jgi:hypothetical protein
MPTAAEPPQIDSATMIAPTTMTTVFATFRGVRPVVSGIGGTPGFEDLHAPPLLQCALSHSRCAR